MLTQTQWGLPVLYSPGLQHHPLDLYHLIVEPSLESECWLSRRYLQAESLQAGEGGFVISTGDNCPDWPSNLLFTCCVMNKKCKKTSQSSAWVPGWMHEHCLVCIIKAVRQSPAHSTVHLRQRLHNTSLFSCLLSAPETIWFEEWVLSGWTELLSGFSKRWRIIPGPVCMLLTFNTDSN